MSTRHRHGLVIGKFYPPHAGHALLVHEAARGCERVSVVVMAAARESISLERRVAWLREIHTNEPNVTVTGIEDDHPVDLASDTLWRAHVDLMREAVAGVTAEPVDAVFTSESYGEELGRRLGARHVAVDPSRARAPVSGVGVRTDPVAHWNALAPCVRGHLAWRLVLVGAESTGKTTLAEALVDRLRARGGVWRDTEWVPEFGREATERMLARALAADPSATMESLVWQTPDFTWIAREQREREEAAARRGGPVLVCDTDAFATGVWHERYMGSRSPETEAEGPAAPFHLYLLTDPDDVPFVQDGLRDGESLRHWMTDVFVERLTAAGHRWQWLRGAREERIARALDAVDSLLAAGWDLADPPDDLSQWRRA